jgi:hypothetical protein
LSPAWAAKGEESKQNKEKRKKGRKRNSSEILGIT